jgi:hypothetical protein
MLRKDLGRRVVLMLALVLVAVAASAQTTPPAIFYSDITSGPNIGGETVSGFAGSYVTLYGNNFGGTQGTSTVTLNGSSCARVVSWGTRWLWYQKIVVQLGPSCTSGNFVVTTTSGNSNSLPFAVRGGHIYFVSPAGNNASTGSISAPWQTLVKAYQSVTAGDIVYARAGTVATGQDNYGATLNISGVNGTATSPIAFVNYPSEVPVVNATNGASRCLNGYPNGISYWTFAGIQWSLPSGSECLYFQSGNNIRLIANDVSCPQGSGSTGCITTASDGVPFLEFFGNVVHDTGCPGSMTSSYSVCGDTQKTYHAFYWGDFTGTLSHDLNIGWNDVHNVYGCRGIMVHPADGTAGREAYNFTMHDNHIYNVRCDGLRLANTNANKGAVSVYNNVIWHVGTGPAPSGIDANYSCIYVDDGNGSPTTPVEIYNNTCYDGGSRGASEGNAGAFSIGVPARFRNNIAQEVAGEVYFDNGSNLSNLSGSNNIWFGVSGAPSQTAGNITADPMLTTLAIGSTANLTLSAASPAIGAGTATLFPVYDDAGLIRPSLPSIGAYELVSGSSLSRPNPPTNLQILVQ